MKSIEELPFVVYIYRDRLIDLFNYKILFIYIVGYSIYHDISYLA